MPPLRPIRRASAPATSPACLPRPLAAEAPPTMQTRYRKNWPAKGHCRMNSPSSASARSWLAWAALPSMRMQGTVSLRRLRMKAATAWEVASGWRT